MTTINASRWKLLFAFMIDTAVICGVYFPLNIYVLKFNHSGGRIDEDILGIILWTVIWFATNYWLLAKGKTIGKLIVGISVAYKVESIFPLRYLMLCRYLLPSVIMIDPILCMVIPILDGVFIFGKARRCLHDYIFNTHVIISSRTAQQVDSAEASTNAVPPSEPSGSPR